MDVIPVPEIVVGLFIVLALAGIRALWRVNPFPFAPRPGAFRPPREGMGKEQMRARLIASCVIFAIISVPLILRVVPPNGIYGFRTATTQSSREIWYPANAFAGWALLIAASLSATLLVVLPVTVKRWLLWPILLVPVFGAFVASLAYVRYLN
jgi:hypothetical protein